MLLARRRHLKSIEEVLVFPEIYRCLDRQDVDRRKLVALADLEVVEVVRRRDLHRAGSLFGIGIFIGDDWDFPADDRQDQILAHQMPEALVLRVNRHAGVAEHRLRPRRGDRDEGLRIFRIERLSLDRIAEVPEIAVDLLLLDLEVGDRSEELRIPVDEPLVLVDQPFLVERDEHFEHGLRQAFVHGEALA